MKRPTFFFVLGLLILSGVVPFYYVMTYIESLQESTPSIGGYNGMSLSTKDWYSIIIIPLVSIITIIIIGIDRFFVNRVGTKKVNKVEKIILKILLIPLILLIILMSIQR